MIKRTVFGIVIITALVIVGFGLLLRSCLGKYDERAMISYPLIFEKNGKAIIFSLLRFDRTTSYNQNGGFVQKTVSSSYFIQANDAVTAGPIKEEKIKSHSDISSYPIEIMGACSGKAWLFAGEPMAFDPFSLEKMADIKMMESRNPSLAGKFSTERKYYELDTLHGILDITLKDGSKYRLNTATLIASAVNDEDLPADPVKAKTKILEDALKNIETASKLSFQHYQEASSRVGNRPSADRSYREPVNKFENERKFIDRSRDSIYALQREVSDERSNLQLLESRFRSLQIGNISFGSIKVNTDTFFHAWYGLYSKEELGKVTHQFDYRSSYDDAARNKLWKAGISATDSNKKFTGWNIAEEKQTLGNGVYLQGGFLLSKQTGLPIHLTNPPGFLVVYKEEVGNAGKIFIARVDTSGKQQWVMNTGLKDFSYWILQGNQLIITGIDNKELTSGENNLLHTIDIVTGHYCTYDFFTDKMVH